jgi:hypothetical protein
MRLWNNFKMAVNAGIFTWRKVRNEYGECQAYSDSEPDSLPSAHYLVGNAKYAMNHAVIDRLFTDGEVSLYTVKFPFAEVAMFIAKTFCDQTSSEFRDIGCIYEPVWSEPNKRGERDRLHVGGRLIFSKKGYLVFSNWLAVYQEKFSKDYDFKSLLPIIKDGELVTGHFVEHNCDFESRRSEKTHDGKILNLPDDELYDEWQWMLNNASGRVRITATMWVFDDASDAMLYQLQMR